MNTEDKKRAEFEQLLRARPLRPLPPEWKQGNLTNACARTETSRRSVVSRWLRALPLPVAAAWVVIAMLRVTTPGVESTVNQDALALKTPREVERMNLKLIAWIEQRRAGAEELRPGVEKF